MVGKKDFWEKLPSDTKMTCDITPDGASTDSHCSLRCGKKATWFHNTTCGCGQCDMSRAVCDKHKEERQKRLFEIYALLGYVKRGYIRGKLPLKRELLEGMTFECPRCQSDMEVYEFDKRARGWFRGECKQCGMWIDIIPDTTYLKHKE